jgi:plasmid maintenance system antidote protein VapI
MLPTHRAPTHLGEMLLAEFLEQLGVSQAEAARRMHVSSRRRHAIVTVGRNMPTPMCAYQAHIVIP